MAELEAKLIEEETALRVKQAIEKRVQEVMASDVVQQQLQQHLHTERQRLETQVASSTDSLHNNSSYFSILSKCLTPGYMHDNSLPLIQVSSLTIVFHLLMVISTCDCILQPLSMFAILQ